MNAAFSRHARSRTPRQSGRLPLPALAVCLVAFAASPGAVQGERPLTPALAIRTDDVGMSHAVNMAVAELVATGMPFSASVMVACPWYLEALEILRDQPQVSVGIHLSLNSEWEHYKWGPVSGASAVPTLVDGNGHFFASEAEFAAAGPNLDEVEMELVAQIERALRTGVQIDYLDYHMLTAVSTPELSAIVEELARRYGLGLSRYFGERSASLWDVEPEAKLTTLLRTLEQARPDRANLLVLHLGLENPELAALVDLNNAADPYRVAQHRSAELKAVASPAFRRAVGMHGISLVTYRDIIAEQGLDAMVRPGSVGYSMDD